MPRYTMRQKLLSIGEDYTIADESGHAIFRVDGKLLRVRETFVLEDLAGNELATIRQKLLALHDTMTITRGGNTLATVRKAWLTPLRDRFDVDVPGGADMKARGSILDHEYTLRRGDHTVAEISKRWLTIRDTYAIDVAPGEDAALVLAIAVAIDEMAHDPDEGKG